MDIIESTAIKLSNASLKKLYNPFNRITYQELVPGQLQFPEQLISIFHEEEYANLTQAKKAHLSLLEMVNFFSMNIYGEQSLIREFESRLYRNKSSAEGYDASRYMQHFIHEENSHTFMLSEYCHKYAGFIYRNRTLEIPRQDISFEAQELLMYGRTIVLERFLAYLNARACHDHALGQTTRDCNRAHLIDEVRHIAWDREVISFYRSELVRNSRYEEINLVIQALNDYLETAFHMLYNPRCYQSVLLSNPLELVRKAKENPKRDNSIREWVDSVKDELFNLNMILSIDGREELEKSNL